MIARQVAPQGTCSNEIERAGDLMPRGQVKIKQREIQRVGRALEGLGLSIARVDIEGGKASIVVGSPGKPVDDLDLDKELEEHLARHGQS